MEKELYSWQTECLKRWMACGGHGMVQAATGSGKTLLALTAASRLEEEPGSGLKVKIVVPTSALMRQWSRELREFLLSAAGEGALGEQPDIGLRGGGQNRLIFEFASHIEPYSDRFFSLGLSATLPSGEAGRFLASVLGPRIYKDHRAYDHCVRQASENLFLSEGTESERAL